MNVAELDLQGYEVMELTPENTMATNGGFLISGFWWAVAATLTAEAISDVIRNPDDFMEGYNAARS